MPKVLFTIKLDPDAGCCQGNFLEGPTKIKGEKEWLFSAYSAFQVVSAKSAYEHERCLSMTGLSRLGMLDVSEDQPQVSYMQANG